MVKIEIDRNVFIPMPVCIVGSGHAEKPNYMTVGWVSRVNAAPPMIAVAIGNSHYTSELINLHSQFSINFPSEAMLVQTDYVGLVSGRKNDKSAVFHSFKGSLTYAPMIEEAPVCMECELKETMLLPSNTLFVGEIKGVWCNQSVASGKHPDYNKAAAFFLTMPDNIYRGFGKDIGKAWHCGKNFHPNK